MTSRLQALALLVGIAALTSCATRTHATVLPSHDRTESVPRLPLGHNAGEDPAAFLPHGTEIANGRMRMISAGNLRILVGPEAKIERTGQAVVVTAHGRTRIFPADAVVTESGFYHRYTALKK